MLGCSKMEEIPQNTSDLRTEIIKEKTDTEVKDLFFSLTFENQKELWSSKLNQILKTKISEQQKTLLNQLKKEIGNTEKFADLYGINIQKLAINLAENTSKTDFIAMFTNLRDYHPSNEDPKAICNDCISSLESDWKFSEEILSLDGRLTASCNCKWTCGLCFCTMDVVTTSNCTKTSLGCGFLLLQSCEKRDDLK